MSREPGSRYHLHKEHIPTNLGLGNNAQQKSREHSKKLTFNSEHKGETWYSSLMQ